MMQWTVDAIVRATRGQLRGVDAGQQFSGVAIDSRTITPDQLFVAIIGERHDGHRFVENVVSKGVRGLVVGEASASAGHARQWAAQGVACVAVADTLVALGRLAAFQRSQANIPVVAVTGSNGKTSTRQMTALVMAQGFCTLATTGNLNNEVGVPLTLFGLQPQHQAAVLELGMNHPGEMDRLGAICQPTLGVITNVAAAHLAFLGSLEGVARAKGELIAHIDARGALILNREDPQLMALARQAPCKVISFGLTPGADIRAENVHETAQGVIFELVLPEARATVRLRTPGRFMVANALAAAAVGHEVGLTIAQIKAGLEAFEAEKGRLQIKITPGGVHLIDDTYNANPQSVAAALRTLADLKGPQDAYVVLGDMLELGEQAAALHIGIGRQAAQSGVDRLFLYGNYARSTAEGAQTAGMDPEHIFMGSKEDIAARLCRQLKAGHWVLVKGSRGMAMEDVVAALMTPTEATE
jgi:UDP-N-acetylmuramoyl-tripeptide--D-alanyl-D-alanine ligase